MNKDADQESFCSDSDDAGTSDSDTVAADGNSVPSQHHPAILVTAQEACYVHRDHTNGREINTRNIILMAADNRGLCLSGVIVQQVHIFMAV
jgi:hypothetical protein